MQAALVLALLPGLFGPSPVMVGPQRLFWSVVLQDAQSLSSGFIRYRVYPPCQELTITLSLTNEGPEDVAVVSERFSRSIAVTMWRDNEPAEVETEWDNAAAHAKRSGPFDWAALSLIQIEPESWLRWTARIRPARGDVFTPGEYRIEIAAVAQSLVRTSGGQRWAGAVNLDRLPLIVSVERPRTPGEAAQAHWIAGSKALRNADHETAMQEFREALAANPSDRRLLAGIALIHYRRGNYTEAVRAYEEVFKIPGERHGSVPVYLACSYVGLNDYTNAARVLRSAGAVEADVPAQLAACREKQAPVRR